MQMTLETRIIKGVFPAASGVGFCIRGKLCLLECSAIFLFKLTIFQATPHFVQDLRGSKVWFVDNIFSEDHDGHKPWCVIWRTSCYKFL